MYEQKIEEQKKELLEAYNGEFVSKSNVLITGKFRSTLQANRINYMNNLKLQMGNYIEDPETKELVVKLYPTEITRMLKLKKGGSIYQTLDSVALQLIGTFIGVTDPENERFKYINLVTESRYENGILETRYNPHMKGLLINLSKNFTKLPKDLMMSWKSTASYRMYELMKQRAYYPHDYKGPRNGVFQVLYDVYELRLLLGVVNSNLVEVRRILESTNPPDYKRACEQSPEKLYEDWYSFRRSIIDVAVNEINKNKDSDIELSYKPLKKKHGEVYAVEFTVYLKKYYKKREDNLPIVPISVDTEGEVTLKLSQTEMFVIQLEVVNLLKNYNIGPEHVFTICEKAKYDVDRIRKIVSILEKQKKVENVVGWILTAIERDYAEPISYERKKKNDFNSFEQNDYDFEVLEEELLANNSRLSEEIWDEE